jgi:vancomycin resistance protein YoaR
MVGDINVASPPLPLGATHRRHTPTAQHLFWIKSRLLMLQRGVRNLGSERPASHRTAMAAEQHRVLAEDRSSLYTATDHRETELELGKVHNLRIAAQSLHGLLVHSEQIFSFWHAIGRPSERKGYVIGRELRHGCMIPTIAGGICQLTNALSRCATLARCEIVERHKHTAAVDGLVINEVTDATVFWNYLDLRFRPSTDIQLSVKLTADMLIVTLHDLGSE